MQIERKHTQLDEKSYRALPILSYSSIKDFSNSRKNFYKKYILGSNEAEDISDKEHVILGNLTDIMLTGTQEDFDNKFVIDDTAKPTGQLADLGSTLWEETKKALNEDNYITRDFTELFQDAFDKIKFNYKGEAVKFKKTSWDEALLEFNGSEVENLYKFRRDNIGKTTVSIQEVGKATKIKDEVLNTPWTREVYFPSDSNIEVLHQLTHQFTYLGLDLKIMADTVHINHKDKWIQPFDGKCTAFVESFEYDYHVGRRYFLQGCLYRLGIQDLYPDYDVKPMKFVTMSATLQEKPLIYETTELNFKEGLWGFKTENGMKIRGLNELIEEINWAKESGQWAISKKAYKNNGVIKLNSFTND